MSELQTDARFLPDLDKEFSFHQSPSFYKVVNIMSSLMVLYRGHFGANALYYEACKMSLKVGLLENFTQSGANLKISRE